MQRRQFLASAAIAATFFAVAPSFAADTVQSVVEAYVAAWNAHDSAKAAGYFADDVTYYDASVGKPVTGKEAAKTGVIDNFLKAVPDAVWTMKGKPLVDGDRSPSNGSSPAPTPAPGATAPRRPARNSPSPAPRCFPSRTERSRPRATITTHSASTNSLA